MAEQPNPPPGAGDGQSTALTPEEINRLVNSAVTSQLKRALPTALSEAFNGLKLDEKIAEAVKTLQPKPQEPPAGQGGEPPRMSPEVEKRLKDMEKLLESSQAQVREAEEKRQQAEQAQRREKGRNALTAAFGDKLRAGTAGIVVDLLDGAYRRLGFTDDGEPTLIVDRPQYKGGPIEKVALPIAEAVPLFLQSQEAAPFLPAPGGQPPKNGAQPTIPRGAPLKTGETLSDSDRSSNAVSLMQRMGVDPGQLG